MSIIVDAKTKVICQGITGAYGALHTKGCLHYGTQVVGGVTPGTPAKYMAEMIEARLNARDG